MPNETAAANLDRQFRVGSANTTKAAHMSGVASMRRGANREGGFKLVFAVRDNLSLIHRNHTLASGMQTNYKATPAPRFLRLRDAPPYLGMERRASRRSQSAGSVIALRALLLRPFVLAVTSQRAANSAAGMPHA